MQMAVGVWRGTRLQQAAFLTTGSHKSFLAATLV